MANWKIALLSVCTVWMMCAPIQAFAEVKQAELVETHETRDLKVSFDFETEVVDITFISPSGERKTKDSADVEFKEDDLWALYTIKNAEPGKWSVEYDLKTNSSIDGNVMTGDVTEYELWVKNVSAKEIDGNTIQLGFETTFYGEDIPYIYEVRAISTTNNRISDVFVTGNGVANKPETLTADISKLASDTYIYQISVTGQDRSFQLVDGAKTEPIPHTNTEKTKNEMVYDVSIDQDDLNCTINWENMNNSASLYYLKVSTDQETLADEILDSGRQEYWVTYPETSEKIEVTMAAIMDGFWTEEKHKTINIVDGSETESIREVAQEVTEENIGTSLNSNEAIKQAETVRSKLETEQTEDISQVVNDKKTEEKNEPKENKLLASHIFAICGIVLCGTGAFISYKKKKE